MAAPQPRKGMPSPRLDEAEFRRRFLNRFQDPNFDALRSEPEFAEILNRHSMGGLALLNL